MGISRSSPLARRSLLAIIALVTYLYMRVAYLRACAPSARVVHPTTPSRPLQCLRPQHGQRAVGFTPARRRRSGAIDRLQASQVGISHHGQGACCKRLRVCNAQYWKDRTHENNRRIPTLRSQDCMGSLLSGCARGSVIHALIHSRTEIHR